MISPVMAKSLRTVRPVSSETSAAAIDTPSRRPVLGNGTHRHVQVHVGILVEPRVDAVAGGVGAQP